jgi:hypothetical protein
MFLPALLSDFFFDGTVTNPRTSSSGFAFIIRNLLATVCLISGALFGLVFGSVRNMNINYFNSFLGIFHVLAWGKNTLWTCPYLCVAFFATMGPEKR